jgi:hypothetical protein
MILLCNISCSVLNGSVDCTDGDGGGDSFEFNNMLSFIMQIRLEAPKRQRGREGERERGGDKAKMLLQSYVEYKSI